MTTARVLFVPNRTTPRRNRAVHDWRLGDVVSIDARDRDFTPYTGGMHRRLGIELRDGTTILFVVKRLDEVVGELQRLIVG